MSVPIGVIDNGRNATKIYIPSKNEAIKFPSILGEWKDRTGFRDLKYGNYDLEIEVDNQKYYGGNLAEYECTWGTTLHTKTKDNKENLINILTALHLTVPEGMVKVITCQPIKVHTDENKQKIKDMLIGKKSITINGITKTFNILDVAVACESGVAAYSLSQIPSSLRLLDFGSATVNIASLRNKKFIRNESDTLFFGLETEEDINEERMAKKVISHSSKKWNSNDQVVLVGGGASKFHPYIKEYFPNTQIHPNAEFANVIGMWKVACSIWQ